MAYQDEQDQSPYPGPEDQAARTETTAGEPPPTVVVTRRQDDHGFRSDLGGPGLDLIHQTPDPALAVSRIPAPMAG